MIFGVSVNDFENQSRIGFFILWLCLTLLLPGTALADQTIIPSYSSARNKVWTKLYPHGGWTIYCGDRFEEKSRPQCRTRLPSVMDGKLLRVWK
jgi:hypothetical protein